VRRFQSAGARPCRFWKHWVEPAGNLSYFLVALEELGCKIPLGIFRFHCFMPIKRGKQLGYLLFYLLSISRRFRRHSQNFYSGINRFADCYSGVQNFVYAFSFYCHRSYDRNSERLAQFPIVDEYSLLLCKIHLVKREYHGLSKLGELYCEYDVPFQRRGIDDVHHDVFFAPCYVFSGHALLY